MRKIFIFSALAFALLVLTSFIRFYDLNVALWVSNFICFLVALLLSVKYPTERRRIVLTLSLTTLILLGLVSINERPGPGFPDVIFMAVAYWVGGIVASGRLVAKITGISIFLAISLAYAISFKQNWLNLINYGSLTQRTQKDIPQNWTNYLFSSNKADSLKDKYVVIDFYSTGCGVCVREFPLFAELYNKNKGNGTFYVCAVNIPYARDKPGAAENLVRKRGFDFPIFVAQPGADSIFGITVFPTIEVVKNGQILYKGNLESASEFLSSIKSK